MAKRPVSEMTTAKLKARLESIKQAHASLETALSQPGSSDMARNNMKRDKLSLKEEREAIEKELRMRPDRVAQPQQATA